MTPTTTTTATAATRRALSDGLSSKVAYLTRALKTPTIGRVWEDLAAQARDANWSHEEYLTAVLERQVADRESAGSMMRVRTAHFPQVKTLEDFNLDHLPSLRKDVLAHLATAMFVPKADNVVLLGPPGIGKTHLAIGLGIKAAQAGQSVLFDTATNWVSRLGRAHHAGAAGAGTEEDPPLPADHHQRGRVHPVRHRRRQPVLPARRLPLRTGLGHGHLEPAVRALGRGLRRRGRRRRNDRPARPPRRGPHPRRRLLPHPSPPRTTRQRPRQVGHADQQAAQSSAVETCSAFSRR